MAVRVRVLGPVEVIDDAGVPLAVGSRNQRVVLAVLACQPGRTVATAHLIDALWGEEPPRTADHSLRAYVSRLRHLLGDRLAIRPGGYALELAPDAVDASRFEALLRQAEGSGPAAVERLGEALELWRGPAFADLADVDALRGVAVRLDEPRLGAREARAAALLKAGHAVEATALAEELVAEAPLREGAWVTLIDALAATGRVAEALRAFQRAATALAEAGLAPSDELRRAEAAALARETTAFQPRRPPVPASSLVGREVDLDQLERLVSSARIVTLTGPGGVGKTRLALEVAKRVADRHDHGARMVELAAVNHDADVAGAVVAGLGMTVESGSPATTLARAGELDVLVLLDNCEHVIDEAARIAGILVAGGDRLRVLATSRERLAVDGEHTWAVTPLPLTGPRPAAQQLFFERASAARRGLQVRQDDAIAVDRIVRRLDGLPLAIEMAAALAATLPLAELADRLDGELELLRSVRRPGGARHRTLAAVVEWSEALLDDEQRELFAELSIFSGMVETDDVAAVTGRASPLQALCDLADRSLLVVDTAGERARFGMLATVRAHAARRLAGGSRATTLARRHAEHLLDVARTADRALRTPGEGDAHRRLDALTEELRAAHSWARRQDVTIAQELSGALHVFAQSRLRDEPLSWAASLEAELAAAGLYPPAMVLASAGQRAVNAGDLGSALALAERGVSVARTARERWAPLEVLADVHLYRGELDATLHAARRMLVEAIDGGDPHAEASARVNIALAEAYSGRVDRAEEALARPAGGPALSPSDEGWLAYGEGEVILDADPGRALRALDRAVVLADAVGNRYLGGVARVSACSLRARAGDLEEAVVAFASVIEHWRRQRTLTHQLTALRNLVVLLHRMGAARETAELVGTVAGDALAPTYGDEAARLAAARTWACSVLGEDEVERRAATGASRSVDDAARVALSWLGPS